MLQRPIIKKNLSPAYQSTVTTGSAATITTTTANPLTPPNSDGSNYSTTPSPHDTTAVVHAGTTAIRGTTQVAQATAGHLENAVLQSSSVMLSPYSDHHNGIGCSPPQMVPQLLIFVSFFLSKKFHSYNLTVDIITNITLILF